MLLHPWPFFFLLFFSSPIILALNPQGQSLLSWKTTLHPPPDALHSWNPAAATPCLWYGVVCNSRNEVVELNLNNMDLHGTVPANFSSLESLTKLAFSGNNLTGSIPEEIGRTLRELKVLDLSFNGLSGEIPSSICSLVKMERLYLNSNGLEGSIPVEIGNMTELIELMIFDNQLGGGIPLSVGDLKKVEVIRAGGNKNLDGALPREIGNCSNLIMLGLAETSMSGILPDSLGLLKNLETIAIYSTLISGQIPPEIGECVNLRSVYLYDNALAGSIPAQLGKLRNLQSLLLWQNELVGTIPPELGNCRQLIIVDASVNSLTGSIPESFGNLSNLQELQLSANQISGRIPAEIGNCTALSLIELDNNLITGGIPSEIGNLSNLSMLYLWQNRLEGNIPESLSSCHQLELVDLSQNALTGSIPSRIFNLQKLKKLLLLSNNLSGVIPPEIGNCSSFVRFRASNNKLTGNLPPEIGKLENLDFLDFGYNRLSGVIPPEISGCRNLSFLDLHSNSITGNFPESMHQLVNLQFLDVSDNLLEGALSSSLGSLSSLTKLILAKNRFSGSIPVELGSCSRLQLLDLSSNEFEYQIPASLGKIPALEIALNLSCNKLSGGIPEEFNALDRLGVLDVSYNHLSGDLHYLADLENLVALNVSHNNFSGHVPASSFFARLPLNVLAGNPELCFSGNECSGDGEGDSAADGGRGRVARAAMVVLLCMACVLLLTALYIIFRDRIPGRRAWDSDSEDDTGLSGPWEVTVYQKLDLSIINVAKCLTDVNVIGRGRSGLVYRAVIPSGQTIAVKRFRPSEKLSAATFSSEIATLARIRHRNIVRLLGWAANGKSKLLLYDYLPNGTLGALLHEGRGGGVDWEVRFKVAVGVAEGLAYLHHDCAPPILHRDVKAENILLGERYEPCLADFGLARFLEDESASFSAYPQFAGSYGYFAPEYASMQKISEKSDVYSFGVVLLEIITRKRPVDPLFPDGQHLVQWVRDRLKSKHDVIDIIDQKLQSHLRTHVEEMVQALGVALLCTSNRAEERPTMKDVVALLREIRHDQQIAAGDQPHKPLCKSSRNSSQVSWNSSSSSTSFYARDL